MTTYYGDEVGGTNGLPISGGSMSGSLRSTHLPCSPLFSEVQISYNASLANILLLGIIWCICPRI
ncbi:MAG TPA: hypothetical protein O0X23_05265 [Methanocorpusculum sp.]|nr:hypothetical protein [Methanocorpusculum sp.]